MSTSHGGQEPPAILSYRLLSARGAGVPEAASDPP